MVTLVNRAKMSTSTTGTGTITLGSAESGYQSFADAGVSDGDVVRYVIEDGDDWEIGSGTYTSTGTTMSRTVDESSNSDAALNLTGSAVVFITAAAGDVFQGELFAENWVSSVFPYAGPTATGNNAVALGSGSFASATNCFAAVIGRATSTYGAISTGAVAIGEDNKSSSLAAVTVGNDCIASGTYSVALGKNAKATNTYAYGLGGFSNASGVGSYAIGKSTGATAQYSVAMGALSKTTIEGQFAFSGEQISAQGDSQTSIYVLRSDTTDATPEAMVTNGPNTTRGTTNQVILLNNSAYAFHGTIVARQQASAGTASAAWKVEGLIRREGSAGTTVLVNSATTVLDNTPAWGMALSADTTNGGLAITVTGAAATNIRWVATINTSEVTYA